MRDKKIVEILVFRFEENQLVKKSTKINFVMNLTQIAHEKVLEAFGKNTLKCAIDATLGKGRDALFAAEELLSDDGIVYGFDVQKAAIEESEKLFTKKFKIQIDSKEEKISKNIKWHFEQISHEKMENFVAKEYVGKVGVIFFNLGWLPNSDKTTITKSATTVLALEASVRLIGAGKAVLSTLCYRGHSGGEEEYQAVKNFYATLSNAEVERTGDQNIADSPILLTARINF